MTLEEAVEVLNREKHNGFSDWSIWESGLVSSGGSVLEAVLTYFETIAIAEKYERQAIEEETSPKYVPGPRTFYNVCPMPDPCEGQ